MIQPSRQRPGMPFMRMQWRDLLFMHWPVPVEAMRPLIPKRLELDTFDGMAWIALVPFTMRNVLPTFVPPIAGTGDISALTAFHECNVRTYVTCKGEPGVWFFSLDAASRLAVWGAQRLFHLPYFNARMSLDRSAGEVRYAVQRVGLRGSPSMTCHWRASAPLPRSQPGGITHFLTERYCLYADDERGDLFRGRIRHLPWALRDARLLHLEDQLIAAAGITVDPFTKPLLHHADVLDVQAWLLERA